MFVLFVVPVAPASVAAQVIPDTTLPVNSTVLQDGNTFVIDGGTPAGANLFHSFVEFSIPSGMEARFQQAPAIDTIFARVTGGNPSFVDGTLSVDGMADLFLLNARGIFFGANARLNLNGSFIASTADRLLFADGTAFDTVPGAATPLLSVNVPLGMQWNQSQPVAPAFQGTIQVEGTGFDFPFSATSPTFSPVEGAGMSAAGLRVPSGETLALLGRNVLLQGGLLTAPEGAIALAAIQSGTVGFAPVPATLNGRSLGSFTYKAVETFGNISLNERALLDASGNGFGSISIQGQDINLREGSLALIQNQGVLPSGAIAVQATGALIVEGAERRQSGRGGFLNETLGFGMGGDISVTADSLSLQNSGGIGTRTFGIAPGGNITLQVANSLELVGVAPLSPDVFSSISAQTLGVGKAGNVTVSARSLLARDGSSITSIAFLDGSGGDVTVDVAESIELIGVNAVNFSPTALGAATLGSGDAGDLTIRTGSLLLRDGGRVDTSTGASGDAGRLTIDARDFIEVRGTVPGSINPSLVASSANRADEAFRQAFRLPPLPSGDAGDVIIRTGELRVLDGASINVRNDGTGDGGRLQVEADTVRLEGNGGITASTQSGNGGIVTFQVNNLLVVRSGSQITVEALGDEGDGGNLAIRAETAIALLEESRISANALGGAGGNIQIFTRSIFRATDSAITASSSLGVDGIVEIRQPEIDPSTALVQLDVEVGDRAQVVRSACQDYQGSEFVLTGRGGLPPAPGEAIERSQSWMDWRDPEMNSDPVPISQPPTPTPQMVEARGWIRHDNGVVELVAYPTTDRQSGEQGRCRG